MSHLGQLTRYIKLPKWLAFLMLACVVFVATHPVFAGGGEVVFRMSSRWIKYPREAYELLATVAMIFSKLSGIVAVIASALYARGKKPWSTSYRVCFLIGLAGGFYAVREFTVASSGFLQMYSAWLSAGGAVLASILWSVVVGVKLDD